MIYTLGRTRGERQLLRLFMDNVTMKHGQIVQINVVSHYKNNH